MASQAYQSIGQGVADSSGLTIARMIVTIVYNGLLVGIGVYQPIQRLNDRDAAVEQDTTFCRSGFCIRSTYGHDDPGLYTRSAYGLDKLA